MRIKPIAFVKIDQPLVDRIWAERMDLLAALQWISDHGDEGEGGRPACHSMRAHARAVMAKAKGVA